MQEYALETITVTRKARVFNHPTLADFRVGIVEIDRDPEHLYWIVIRPDGPRTSKAILDLWKTDWSRFTVSVRSQFPFPVLIGES